VNWRRGDFYEVLKGTSCEYIYLSREHDVRTT